MDTDLEIKQQIAKDYGNEFWYYSHDEQKTLINVYKEKQNERINSHSE